MGKRIRVRRRGRGNSHTFKAATHKRIAPAHYPNLLKNVKESMIRGHIIELLHEPGRGTPLASIELENGKLYYSVVPEGMYKGQIIEFGEKASSAIGNVIPMKNIPEGTIVCNIELLPGDGGKLVRSSGTYAAVVAHTPSGTTIKLPSGKTRYVNDLCLATVGVVSAAGRVDRPFLKAGPKFHLMHAKGHKYHMSRGIAMVAASHPYGSGSRGARKGTTVSRNAPPGRKVGLISARRAGKKKK